MDLSLLNPNKAQAWLAETRLARGDAYLMAKGHRLTGILLSLYMIMHVYTLWGLSHPEKFDQEMKFFESSILGIPIFTILEWALILPLAFHALNGGRLMLFELFRSRDDAALIRWALGIAGGLSLFMGLLFISEDAALSAFSFWTAVFSAAVVVGYVVASKVWRTRNTLLWKLQRITGASLIPLALGHFLFMHIEPEPGHRAQLILQRLGHPAMLVVDFLFLAFVLFHGWYGCRTIINDNFSDSNMRNGATAAFTAIVLVMLIYGVRILALAM